MAFVPAGSAHLAMDSTPLPTADERFWQFWDNIPERVQVMFARVMPSSVVDAVESSGKDLCLDERLQLLAYAVGLEIERQSEPASQVPALHLLALIKEYQDDYDAASALHRNLLVGEQKLSTGLEALLNLVMVDAMSERWPPGLAEAQFWSLVPLLHVQGAGQAPRAIGGLWALMRCVLKQEPFEDKEIAGGSHLGQILKPERIGASLQADGALSEKISKL